MDLYYTNEEEDFIWIEAFLKTSIIIKVMIIQPLNTN